MFNSLPPYELQHARLPCPSLSPWVCTNSCPCHPTISSSVASSLLLPSIFPIIRVFSNELVLHIRWPKYWSFSFSISPSNEYSRLTSFRTDWFDLLAVQGTLKNPPAPQFKSSNSSALSLVYDTTLTSIHHQWKNYSFDYRDFLDKVISLLFNMLSRFVIAFLPRKKEKTKVLVAQSCPSLCDPMDCSLPDSSVHGILQARIPGRNTGMGSHSP